jgi:hypothetical protein
MSINQTLAQRLIDQDKIFIYELLFIPVGESVYEMYGLKDKQNVLFKNKE